MVQDRFIPKENRKKEEIKARLNVVFKQSLRLTVIEGKIDTGIGALNFIFTPMDRCLSAED